MGLLMLAPEIQEELLFRTDSLPQRQLIPLVHAVRWADQVAKWRLPRAA